MKDWIEYMQNNHAHIAICIETHLDKEESNRLKTLGAKQGYKVYSVTRHMRRHDNGSGGVSIFVEEGLKSREVRVSELEDFIWVCVEGSEDKLFIGGIYLVPTASTRARKAEELVEELGRDIVRYQKEGSVLVAGDWNCKIGELESEVKGVKIARRSQYKNIDKRGLRIVEIMNTADMIILNGVRGSEAEYTCTGIRGIGIDDYVAVSNTLYPKVSNIYYFRQVLEYFDNDHCALFCTIQQKKHPHNTIHNEEKKDNRKKEKGKESFALVAKIKHRNFWEWLRERSDEEMEKADQEMKEQDETHTQSIEESWNTLKTGITNVLQKAHKRAKREGRRKKEEDGEVKKIREEMKIEARKEESRRQSDQEQN
jgi:hypothetical protein